ncbi:nitroreductase family protein [Croceicoccus sp. Ery5]|uniref:nitroreductase family protein n=1 Tax=Croceicoccus sp. Ery5 TaxID=1703340 RepID=UPI001E5F3AC9|nr:nitroreductase family protein [Croceicoccus sp. Ery5]
MTNRTSALPVDPLFLDRWSPRSFDGSAMKRDQLMTILEAGRWAPSAFNYQPWRFLFSMRGDAHWGEFLNLLIPFNAGWARDASALVFVVSDEKMRSERGDKPSHSHSFDAGSAWGFMALQAHKMGFATHGMTGLEFDKCAEGLALPDGFRVEAAFVVGLQGDAALLPEGLRERELPSDRKPLDQIAMNGPFSKPD